MDFFKRAAELQEETVENRRYLHQNAEVGLELPRTKKYIMEKLREYGMEPQECGHGVVAMVGKKTKGKVILLKADMDALPMEERSGLPFACPTGTEAHTCGHDLNSAMLLTAARMLKEQEEELEGRVKIVFEPAEEIFKGGKDMIAAGVLQNPEVDAALSFHIGPGGPPGGYFFNKDGATMASCDGFRIKIAGAGAHGAYPHLAKDPLNAAVKIYEALQEVVALECDPAETCTLTIGHMQAGTVFNIIPDTAVMEGSIRTMSREMRKLLVTRMKEIVNKTAEMFHVEAEIEMLSEVPPLICNQKLADEMLGYLDQVPVPNKYSVPGVKSSASDDFAEITERVPGGYMFLAGGFADREAGVSHSPEVQFNEEALLFGAGAFAYCASEWLKNNQ